MTIYVFSGPCGCGKSTLTESFAQHLIKNENKLQVYVIHGDDFHRGLKETDRRLGPDYPGFLYWADVLRFNWDCMLTVAQNALDRGLDVLIDYVVEDELPLLEALAEKNGAKLCYIVLTASEDELKRRLTSRGDPQLIERSLFLKQKLEHTAGRYLFDISGMTVEEEIAALNTDAHEVPLS